MKRPSIIEFIKQLLYDIFEGTAMKKYLKAFYLKHVIKKDQIERNAVFKEHAVSVLKSFKECMDANNIEYTLAFGSMLGAVREHGFIKHDLDLDTNIWYNGNCEYIQKCLEEYGFKLIHFFSVDDDKNGREETYIKDGVTIDIFYIYDAIQDLPYCCDFVKFKDSVDWTMSNYKHGGLLPRRLELPFSRNRVMAEFEGVEVYIQENAHEILSMRYGSDYMVPNPGWVNGFDNPHIIEWYGKIAKFTKLD